MVHQQYCSLLEKNLHTQFYFEEFSLLHTIPV